MKLERLYELIVKIGMEADPRPKNRVAKGLAETRKAYGKLKGESKAGFDKEKLTNPYADTRILCGDRNKEIKTILVGIDIEVGELLLFDKLNSMGRSIDLIMSHHPHGSALARLSQVMNIHTDMLHKFGIPYDVAVDLMNERIKEVERAFQSRNYARTVDAAKLLDIPFICCHTVADNLVSSFVQQLLDKAKPKNLQGVINVLNKVQEYKEASVADAGPKIVLGRPNDDAGKIFVDMTGGTEGSKRAFSRLSQAGVKTLVCMHLSEEHLKSAKKEYINIIIAGHMASDSIGINLLLDKLGKFGEFEFIPCSGFIRVKR